ncbi:MAG TPA: haloacid dehalogenase type II [Intrasporangium sp.]|uniref:haloacid dehalogenase type II n=1 Tax=Intrasporangium sp. TaxID=1925024 RepID=UPI002D773F31|nr:haloacid dehalogenase type II [Intrasporangium sp.]HET7399898.1 haloacid dehalogenase type II [Intrasporangium sp.]
MTAETPSPDADQRPDRSMPSLPRLLIFDVNETLSDLAGVADRFEAAGVPRQLASTWFAGVLRDGFALTVTGDRPRFADLAASSLTALLRGVVDDPASVRDDLLRGFTEVDVHPDVVEGVRDLQRLGIRLVTLSNGARSVAEGLLARSGVDGCFDRLLSVEEAPAWKPAAAAYEHALTECDVPAAEAMLVAVHPWDIHGATRAGLRTAWVNRSGADYPETFAAPDLEATSIVDLAAQLGAVSA